MKAKRLFISVMALCCTMVAGAQSNQSVTAILQHVVDGNETVKVYVGKEAFKKAYNDAVNGDVITLSSGSFDTPSPFQKELSVYGAGYEEDAETGTAVTILNNSINIKGVASLSNLHFEGLRLDGNIIECNIPVSNMVISKCFCKNVFFYAEQCTDIVIQQSVITQGITGLTSGSIKTMANNLRIKNCILSSAGYFDPSSRGQLDHCLLLSETNNTQYAYVYPLKYTNCVFGKKGYTVGITGTLEYCILPYGGGAYIQSNLILLNSNTPVFTDGDGWASSYSADRTYTLSNPNEWIGNDGTQIGIHGGMGFSKVPSTPVIKNMTVTPEGKKIKVNYETNVR